MKRNIHHDLVLVTGANSLLGANTILDLLEHGFEVRGMLRRKSSWKAPLHNKLELFEGNITNQKDTEKALESCRWVVHTAADTRQNLLKLSDYEEVNINATRDLANACLEKGIEKMIFTGTANAFGHGTYDEPGNEKSQPSWPFTKSLYAQSKIMAQQLVLNAAEKSDSTAFITINPGFMLGPWDVKPSSGQIILMHKMKPFILCPPGGKNFVHVKDVAKTIRLALTKGENREEYLVTGTNMSFYDFFHKLNTISGRKKPVVVIPPMLLRAAGKLGDIIRATGFSLSLSSVNSAILCENPVYTNQKAINELGTEITPIDETLYDAIDWFDNEYEKYKS